MTRTRPVRKKPLVPERRDADVFTVAQVTVRLDRRDILCMMAEALASGIASDEQEDRVLCRTAAERCWRTRRELKAWLQEQVRTDPGTAESAGWIAEGGSPALLAGVSDHLTKLFPEWGGRPDPAEESTDA